LYSGTVHVTKDVRAVELQLPPFLFSALDGN